MIDVFDLYNDFCARVNTFQGGNFRLETDFLRNVNAIYLDIWERETKNARKSQASKDNMIAFLITKNIIIQPDSFSRYSVPPLPKNYGRFSSARIAVQQKVSDNVTTSVTIPDASIDGGKCFNGRRTVVVPIEAIPEVKYVVSEKSIELINDDQWAACLEHKKKYPTLAAPKMVQINGTFQIAPKEVTVIVFSYYKMPDKAKLSVTYTPGDDQSGNGDEVIYNASKSTPLLLPPNMEDEILWRLGEIYGFYTREQFLAAFGNAKEKESKP